MRWFWSEAWCFCFCFGMKMMRLNWINWFNVKFKWEKWQSEWILMLCLWFMKYLKICRFIIWFGGFSLWRMDQHWLVNRLLLCGNWKCGINSTILNTKSCLNYHILICWIKYRKSKVFEIRCSCASAMMIAQISRIQFRSSLT